MSSKPERRTRPAAPGVGAKEDIAAMIRVDHAGEYGAVRIYEGQLAVFGASKASSKT
ncbi:MAG: demethoxyubiquinone hydroxylase family protein, partial [Alphaproteobacteria bacterium]|nr:demethoxyubiquinone hydroxylase family protein [Alphaproteobacteria bacterium]